jgi:integrase
VARRLPQAWRGPHVRKKGTGWECRKAVGEKAVSAYSQVSGAEAEERYREKVFDYVDSIERVRNHTAAEWIERVYLPHLAGEVAIGNRSPQTYRAYESKCRLHICPALGRKRLEEVTPPDVDRLLRDAMRHRHKQWGAGGNKASTANDVRNTLRAAFAYAVYLGVIETNPVARAKPIREEPREVVPISPEELAKFLTVLSGHRHYLAVLLTLATGLRSGEVRGLRWQDIDLVDGTIVLSEQVQRITRPHRGGEFVRRPLKGRRQRIIRVPQTCLLMLRTAFLCRTGAICFPNRHGDYLNAGTLNHALRAAMLDAGLTPRKFHALRHTCASLLAREGVNVYEVAALLGHANPTITQRVYTHLFPADQPRVTATMDAVLGNILGMAAEASSDAPSAQDAPRQP